MHLNEDLAVNVSQSPLIITGNSPFHASLKQQETHPLLHALLKFKSIIHALNLRRAKLDEFSKKKSC